MSWLNLVAATVTIWVGGRAALPYTLTLEALLGVASWVTVLYAARLGVGLTNLSGSSADAWCRTCC